MINLNEPSISLDGVTLFRDHVDRDTWHFLPTRPRLRRTPEGKPEFSFMKYRGEDGRAGGILQFGTEVSVSASEIDAVSHQARAISGADVRLVPIQPERVTCDLVLWNGDARQLIGTTVTPLEHPHPAALFAELTKEGAMMMDAAIRADDAPATVIYRFYVKAFRPGLPSRAEIDWRRVGEFFDVRISPVRAVRYAEIEAAVKELLEIGAIRLSILDPSPEAAEQALGYVIGIVSERLFGAAPALTPAADAPRESVSPTQPHLEYLEYKPRPMPERALAQYDFQQPGDRIVMLQSAATLSHLLEGADATVREPSEVELRDTAFSVDVMAAADFGRDGIELISGSVVYGMHRNDFMLRKGDERYRCNFLRDEASGRAVEYEYQIHMHPDVKSLRRVYAAKRATTNASIILLSPYTVGQWMTVEVFGAFAPEEYRMALVEVKAEHATTGESCSMTLQLREPGQSFPVRIFVPKDEPISVQHKVTFMMRDGEAVVEPWRSTEDAVLVIRRPSAARPSSDTAHV